MFEKFKRKIYFFCGILKEAAFFLLAGIGMIAAVFMTAAKFTFKLFAGVSGAALLVCGYLIIAIAFPEIRDEIFSSEDKSDEKKMDYWE